MPSTVKAALVLVNAVASIVNAVLSVPKVKLAPQAAFATIVTVSTLVTDVKTAVPASAVSVNTSVPLPPVMESNAPMSAILPTTVIVPKLFEASTLSLPVASAPVRFTVTAPVKPPLPEETVNTWLPAEVMSTVKPDTSLLPIVIAPLAAVSLITSMSEETLRVLPVAMTVSAKEIVSTPAPPLTVSLPSK